MTDTYKTSYVVPRKTSVTVGEDEIDVAAYINTCDSCDSCPDSADGTSSDGVWKNGETSVSFYPHLNYSTEKYGMVGGVRSQKRGTGAPSWEDSGGFYFKRRSSKIRVAPDHSAGGTDSVCSYLIKCDFTVKCNSQILNFFRGGSDRMLFLNLERRTDGAFCDSAWPDGSDGRKYQYFYFWRGIGDNAGDAFSGSKLSLNTYTGSFYFVAKPFDIISLEWFEHATRSLNGEGGTNRYLGQQDTNKKRVNRGEASGGKIIEHGPGQCLPYNSFSSKTDNNGSVGYGHDYDILAFMSNSASRWGKRARPLRQHVSQAEKAAFSLYENGDSYSAKFFTPQGGHNSTPDASNYLSVTYNQALYSASEYARDFWMPPSYGWHSLHDLSLGGADAPNQDWELSKKLQKNKSDSQLADWDSLAGISDICNVTINLTKKIIVVPQLIVNDTSQIPSESSFSARVGVPTVDGSQQSISTANEFDGLGEKISMTQAGRAQDTLLSSDQGNFNAKLGKDIQVGGRIGGAFSNNEGFTKANAIVKPYSVGVGEAP